MNHRIDSTSQVQTYYHYHDCATTSDLSSGLATKQASGSYATTSALTSGLATKQASGSYATTSALASGQATKQASGSYATTSALASGLATKQGTISNSAPIAISNVTGLSTALSNPTIPQADDVTLGRIRIDGGNLPINNSTGILSATVNVSQSVVHVGVFTLQATTNLSSATEMFLRWKPGLSATNSSSQGLVHTATSNIPQGTLFTCSDTSGVYNINVQLALTDGTSQSRSFHVAEPRVYTNATSTTSRGDDVRTYFLGSGYARMLSDTNKAFWGGTIQITMEQNDQFEILTSRKYAQNTNALNLNDGTLATRLIIDRVAISKK